MENSLAVFQYMFEQMDLGVLLHGRDCSILHANPAAEKILGISLDVMKNLNICNQLAAAYHEDGRAFSKGEFPFQRALDSGTAVQNAVLNFKPQNYDCSLWIKMTSFPVFLDGNECAVLSMFSDITESRTVGNTSDSGRDFLQLILDTIPQHIFWKDLDLIYQGCNSLFAEVAGVVTPDKIIGKSDFDLVWEKKEAEAFRHDDRSVMDSAEAKLHIIEPQRQSDGKKAWLETNKIPLYDSRGAVSGVLGTFQDITELIETRERIEELLQTENDRLEKILAERTKELESTMSELMKRERLASLGSLVAGVSHEINTPLGVSISASSFLNDKNREFQKALADEHISKEDLFDFIGTVDETTRILNENLMRAAQLVKSFKEISANQSYELKSRFDLRQYVEMIILTLKHEFKGTSQLVKVIPEGAFIINSYPSAFSQVLTNLIMNSLHHAFGPTDEGLISISLEKDADTATITYSDNGKGIESDIIGRIFDPFFTTNREKGGSGLGLNIVYNIVTDKLGGDIRCESTGQKGSTFIIRIPLGEE